MSLLGVVISLFLCDVVCLFMCVWYGLCLVVCLSFSLVCFVRDVLLFSCLLCVWCLSFVCGVLCCCLLCHWFVVRVCCVVVVLYSFLFFGMV